MANPPMGQENPADLSLGKRSLCPGAGLGWVEGLEAEDQGALQKVMALVNQGPYPFSLSAS